MLSTNDAFTNHMYKENLALNNQQWLICHKRNQTKLSSASQILQWQVYFYGVELVVPVFGSRGFYILSRLLFIRANEHSLSYNLPIAEEEKSWGHAFS